ncbi:MAG: cytochrome P450, partial [Acidimicrobiales bacterium]
MGPGAVDVDIDPERPGLFTRPDYYDVLRRLRQESPVHAYAPHRWAVARYEDVRAVSRDPARFCSGQGVLMHDPKRDGNELPGSILHMDPPRHAEWRKVASRWFTPRAVARLEERAREIVRSALDRVDPSVRIDLVDAVTAPIPVAVIAELLGIGDASDADLRRWSDACIESPDDDPSGDDVLANMAAVGELLEHLNAHVVARRAEPRDDLLSVLVEASVEGRPMRDEEIVMYCMSVLVAGNETTRHLLSGTVEALARHPDQRAALVADADPAVRSTAVEECLRWVT